MSLNNIEVKAWTEEDSQDEEGNGNEPTLIKPVLLSYQMMLYLPTHVSGKLFWTLLQIFLLLILLHEMINMVYEYLIEK